MLVQSAATCLRPQINRRQLRTFTRARKLPSGEQFLGRCCVQTRAYLTPCDIVRLYPLRELRCATHDAARFSSAQQAGGQLRVALAGGDIGGRLTYAGEPSEVSDALRELQSFQQIVARPIQVAGQDLCCGRRMVSSWRMSAWAMPCRSMFILQMDQVVPMLSCP